MGVQREACQRGLFNLDRVLSSRTFSHCESLRHILKFLVEKSLSGLDDQIKEYTIATEVLGRPADFDPRADTIVRVQIQRLRHKLEEYYREEGIADPVQIVIPRGNYAPEFHPCSNGGHALAEAVPVSAARGKLPGGKVGKWLIVGLPWGLVILLLLILSLSGPTRRRSLASITRTSGATATLPAALSPLWKFFLPPSAPPILVYSNARLMMNDAGDLYRYSLNSGLSLPAGARVPALARLSRQSPLPPRAGPLYYMDLYTGTGEVMATARIVQLLARQDQGFSIRRSGAVSYDDLRNSNIIFIGASLEDSVLRQLPVHGDLTFEQIADHVYTGRLYIHDRHSRPGKPDSYYLLRNPQTGAFDGEYALVSLLPGLTPGKYILVLGGITTIGTGAAAEFVTSLESMGILEKMRPKIGISNHLPYFQALLRVQIRNGEIAETNCVFVRDLSYH